MQREDGKRPLRKIASHNVRVGRGWRAVAEGLRQLIQDHDPDAILLQEAMNYVLALRLAFPRWTIRTAPAQWPEARNCALMIRRDTRYGKRRRRGGWGWVRMHIGWIGPKHGHEHPGRTWPWNVLDGIPVLCIHRVTGGAGGRNARAYTEEGANLVQWAREHPGPVIIFGDTNTSARDKRPDSMRDVADRIGGRLAKDPDEPGIDYAVTRGVDADVVRVGKYGSDHRAAIMTIRRRRDTLREQMS